jgi:hypothetical protein
MSRFISVWIDDHVGDIGYELLVNVAQISSIRRYEKNIAIRTSNGDMITGKLHDPKKIGLDAMLEARNLNLITAPAGYVLHSISKFAGKLQSTMSPIVAWRVDPETGMIDHSILGAVTLDPIQGLDAPQSIAILNIIQTPDGQFLNPGDGPSFFKTFDEALEYTCKNEDWFGTMTLADLEDFRSNSSAASSRPITAPSQPSYRPTEIRS